MTAPSRKNNLNLSAIILAAGASRRMGSPKGLLTIGGKTFLEHIAGTLSSAGINDCIVVLGADAEAIRGRMDWFRGTIVVHAGWSGGQLSSITAGLDAIDANRSAGAIIWPVDHPLITGKLLRELIAAFETSEKKIVVPTVDGRRGHPVIFHRSLFGELRRAPKDVGARAVLRSHSADLLEFPTTERGVITDIATKSDYEREIHGRRTPAP